jgi:surfeit locus 1 family protein
MAILCTLGIWQLQRLAWKNNLLATMDAEYAKSADEITLTPANLDADFDYRRATLKGRYDLEKQILLGPRTFEKQSGYHVLTPLQLQDSTWIMVNRGWVPQHWSFEDETTPPQGTQTLTGLLRPAEINRFALNNDPQNDTWYNPDLAQIAKAKNIPSLKVRILYLEAPEKQTGNYPAAYMTKPVLPNDHLYYAIFWFTMAAVLAVMYVLRFVKLPKK